MGRKAHVADSGKFQEWMNGVPDEFRNAGYWSVFKDSMGKAGGVIRLGCGFLSFDPGEDYDGLKKRIFETFIDKPDGGKGPGDYNAVPCDSEKKELKGQPIVKIRFTEAEAPMPEAQTPMDINPLGETLKNVKKMSTDMAALQNLEYQQKLMNKVLGIKEDKKEEEPVAEKSAAQGNSISDMLMWKTFMDDSGKKKEDPGASVAAQQVSELKASLEALKAVITQPKPDDRLERLIEKTNGENQRLMEKTAEENRRLMEKMIELSKPKEDSATSRLLEKLVEIQLQPKNDDKLERLIEKTNSESQRLLEKNAEENRRLMEKMIELSKPKEDSETKLLLQKFIDEKTAAKQENAFQSMMAMTMKQQDESNKVRAEEEKRREAAHGDAEKRRMDDDKRKEDERKEDRRRLDDDRRAEQKKAEEQIKLEREKFQDELKEQKRRFDEDMRLRRDEMKHEEEKARLHSAETQKFQLQLLDVFKDKSNSGLDMVSKVVDSMTMAGSNSMKMAQEAATTIMEVAKSVPKKDKDESSGGFGDILKSIAPMVAPLIGPYADADAKLKMLQGAAQIQGQAKRTARAAQQEDARRAYAAAQQQAAQQQAAQAQQAQTEQEEETAGVSGVEAETAGEETGATQKEGFSMIAEYLKAYPIVKETLLDTLADGLPTTIFVNFVTGLNQPTLEALIAGLKPYKLMDQIKRICNPEEQKIVDANLPWFETLRKKMIKLATDEEAEDEAEEAAAPPAGGNGAAAPAPAPIPQVQAPKQ